MPEVKPKRDRTPVLDYTLREAERGIRIMDRDKSALHVFDLGKSPDGQEWCFVMAVVPKSTVDLWGTFNASAPLTEVPEKV